MPCLWSACQAKEVISKLKLLISNQKVKKKKIHPLAKRMGTKGQEALGLTVKAGSCSGTGPPSPCGRVLICEQVLLKPGLARCHRAQLTWCGPSQRQVESPNANGDIQETYSRSLVMRQKLSPYTGLSSPHHPASLSLSLFLLAEDTGNTGERKGPALMFPNSYRT